MRKYTEKQENLINALHEYEYAIENYGYFDKRLPVDEAHAVKEAIEKQIIKKPHTDGSYCSACGTIVLGTGNPLKKYCEFCGQRLFE